MESAKRMAILEAALDLFCDRGFHGTAVPDVARRARVGLGTIYRYFDGKEALVNAVYQRWKTTLYGLMVRDFPFEAAPREQFHVFWQRLAGFARTNARALAFLELHHHAPYLDETSRSLEAAALLPAREFLERTRAAGVTKDVPGVALLAVVWGAFVGLLRAERLGYLEITGDLVARTEEAAWDAIAAR